jgi:flagellar biosynthesis/type III secretory pathway M-ring protein FliF/YscJ
MEPDLITQKTIKKILKKNYFIEESSFNKFIKNINTNFISKVNWLPIVVAIFILFVLIFLYNENQNKKRKQAEQMHADEEMEIINSKSDYIEDDFKSKHDYESQYYKMLPKVTNNPEIHEYKY